MMKDELKNPRAIQELAYKLNIDEPYNVRVLGNRIEFHLRSRVVVHPLVPQPESVSGTQAECDPEAKGGSGDDDRGLVAAGPDVQTEQKAGKPDLAAMTKSDLLELAAGLDIPRRSSMTKAKLIQAIKDV